MEDVSPAAPADYEEKLTDLVEMISGAQTISLCGHVNPDGDCIGSILGLYIVLRALGKDVTPTLAQNKPAPRAYRVLEGADKLVPASTHENADDLCISLDVSTRDRMGEGTALIARAQQSFALDHHPGTDVGAAETLSDPTKAATSMMVWDLVTRLVENPGAACAQACYMALMTDTGRFQFQNADGDAFRTAAQLVDAGADPSRASNLVYQSKTPGMLKLERDIIDRLTLTEKGTVALSWFDVADMKRHGVTTDETESLPEILRAIDGTQVIILLRGDGKRTRGNLRSKDTFDVSALAALFGGGGHRAASGMMVDAPVEKTLARFVALLPLIEKDLLEGHEAPTFTVEE